MLATRIHAALGNVMKASTSVWTCSARPTVLFFVFIFIVGWVQTLRSIAWKQRSVDRGAVARTAIFYYLSSGEQTHIDNYMCAALAFVDRYSQLRCVLLYSPFEIVA